MNIRRVRTSRGMRSVLTYWYRGVRYRPVLGLEPHYRSRTGIGQPDHFGDSPQYESAGRRSLNRNERGPDLRRVPSHLLSIPKGQAP